MNPSAAPGRHQFLAHILPMLTFALLLGGGDLLKTPDGPLWRATPEFWVYPLQTLLCGAMLIFFWHYSDFPVMRRPLFAVPIALSSVTL